MLFFEYTASLPGQPSEIEVEVGIEHHPTHGLIVSEILLDGSSLYHGDEQARSHADQIEDLVGNELNHSQGRFCRMVHDRFNEQDQEDQTNG